jgi:hypothetical protein
MSAPKITIRVLVRNEDDYEGHARIEVHAGPVKVADGYVGGEPEDNRITRDYNWIVPMLEALTKACGGEVQIERGPYIPD